MMIKRVGFSAFAGLCLIGCGGANGLIPNVFEGTYSGNFTAGNTSNGTVTVTIDQNGNLGGNETITSGTGVGTTPTITGTVDDSGNMNGDLGGVPFTGTFVDAGATASATLTVNASTAYADNLNFTSVMSGFSSRKVNTPAGALK